MGNCYTGWLEEEEKFDNFQRKVGVKFKYDIDMSTRDRLMQLHRDTGLIGAPLVAKAIGSGLDFSRK
ncbi:MULTISPECIES: hypothetical protein [Neisseria]|uniref:Uncharacterized protein n=1 Tax=Neisseria dumasiana TaxID=1931275 RepID=A0ABX3WPE9_9NEIS|nr:MULTISPECIES: hypothetical protein [Neisseria]OSI36089.1 hypothetical protein BV913_02705 [Neisseria dumasiana]UOO83543.1 hypothetical protein LVJ88_07440 [Neisseria dumasiana]